MLTKVWLDVDTVKLPAAFWPTAGHGPPSAETKLKKVICCTIMVFCELMTVCVTGGAETVEVSTRVFTTVCLYGTQLAPLGLRALSKY